MTTAAVLKYIKQLEEEKQFYLDKERNCSTYVAEEGEANAAPEYDYADVCATIEGLDIKIAQAKHTINEANALSQIEVEGEGIMSADFALARMAQLNRRKDVLNSLRTKLPKSRMSSAFNRSRAPEYEYANFDIAQAGKDFDETAARVRHIQMALDKYNQTVDIGFDI